MNPAASARKLCCNRHAPGDLLVHVPGTGEVVTVDGQTIGNAGINAMEAAMSGSQSSHAGSDPGTDCFVPQDGGLAGALSAWHAA